MKKDKKIKSKNDVTFLKKEVKILLAHALQDRKYKVESIQGGYNLNSRLNSMGILPGETVKVIYQARGGPMTVAVKGVRIALGRGIAHKIEVSELNE